MTNIQHACLYNDEIEIDFYPDSHRYKLKGRKNYLVSVTGATGIIDKSAALIPWAVNLTSQFIRDFLENAVSNEFTSEELLPIIEEAAVQHTIKKEKAADYGTQIHDLIEKFINSLLCGNKPAELPHHLPIEVFNGVTAFLDWYNNNDVKFLEAERIVYSKNYEYVGFADVIAEVNGKKIIGDWKTGKRVYSNHYYQLSGYWGAYEEEVGKKLDGAIIFHFDKENCSFETIEINREEHEENYKTFLACLVVKEREKELTRRKYK